MLRGRFARPLAVLVLSAVSAALMPAHAGTAEVHRPMRKARYASAMETFEQQLIVEINKARERARVPVIRVADACLDGIAEDWSRHLVDLGDLLHRDQSVVLRRCHQSWAGENLIRGSRLTPAQAVQAWLASPAHKAVLLKHRASRIGIAVRRDGRGRYVGVLNLGDS
ncbi:hypothetical protein DDE18_06035 [Nocardioides gansuensis]|uniref:SCP domain-containing protein n=1 Tax=Nocardioides gansuensis TaxID=2138300 RepID=A0A2T8FDS2_9ACTN|nr:CAP domain-containing protein [Nocardioides gansuensis]PVG83857.1 hypothetical protein DDE18_06035 [Nocardioides gansuensis]